MSRAKRRITVDEAAAAAVATAHTHPMDAPQGDAAGKRPPSSPVTTVAWECLRLNQLLPSPANPAGRSDRNDPSLRELGESLKSLGQQQPIVVRAITGERFGETAAILGHTDPVYEILAGHRRLAAAQLVGIPTLEARVVACDDRGAQAIRVVENLQRKDLHWTDESAGVAALVASGWSLDVIAEQLGKGARWVALRARLAEIDPAWVKLARGEQDTDDIGYDRKPVAQWPVAMLELIGRHPAETQAAMAGDPAILDCADLRELERTIAERYLLALKAAPWDLDDATLVPAAGACSTCPHRSSAQATLFDQDRKGDRCTHATCWGHKKAAVIARREAELAVAGERVVKVGQIGYGEKAAGDVVSVHEVEVVSKRTPGAVAAIDTATGRDVYVKPVSWARPQTVAKLKGAAADEEDADDRKPKVSASDRLAQHLRKRWGHVLKAVLVKLGADPEDIDSTWRLRQNLVEQGDCERPRRPRLVALAAALGVKLVESIVPKGAPTASALGMRPDTDATDRWRHVSWLFGQGCAEDACDAALWRVVRQQMVHDLASSSQDRMGVDPGLLRAVCEVAGINCDALIAAAQDALPLPKTLAQIFDEDGTKRGAGITAKPAASKPDKGRAANAPKAKAANAAPKAAKAKGGGR